MSGNNESGKSESIHLKLSIANEKGMLGMCYYGL